jgi:hypothetical protein
METKWELREIKQKNGFSIGEGEGERERDCLFSSVFFTADSSIGRCALEWREESGKEGNEGTKEAKRKRVSTR